MEERKRNHPEVINISPTKGHIQSSIHRENISKSRKGNTDGFKLGNIPWNKGKRMECMEGENNQAKRPEVREKIRNSRLKAYRKGYALMGYKKGKENINFIDGRSKFVSPGRYGDDWNDIRLQVYKRDRFTCQECDITGKSLDVHHKIPFLYSGDNSTENLITLCRKCHRVEESKMKGQFREIQTEVMLL